MLVNVKNQVESPDISRILEYAVYSDEDLLAEAIKRYQEDREAQLYALKHEEELIGLIGYKMEDQNALVINHLAISPEHRNQGYGRGIILEVLYQEKPDRIIAETDEEGVDFYRNIGFVIETSSKLPNGVERFRCVYEAELHEQEE
ncbi:GNAT family N-acetyltransferase [Paenibacillus sp. YPG26]|uniref:GNAT family N-acetyltransferase n=1 Tax=Paenibacillus sp. YPG26 TaxID=2878915 RepID=UPI0020415F48|nr:GNAT family N-acetyltransferase [Paenibacillus sp. YPG26]USB32158.1 GNAT family N-acetyltransferase [Paenibacillus sp. YPG26]